MNEIKLYDSTRTNAADFFLSERGNSKCNKINVEHTLHCLLQKKYGGKLESFVEQPVKCVEARLRSG